MEAFDHYKNKAGETLVFLHGSAFNRAMWRPQIDALKNDFDLLALDLPGHGVLENRTFTLDTAVSHVADVISSETSGKVVMVGFSLGGYVAIAHAGKHPEQVSGLIVSGSCIQYFGPAGFLARANAVFLSLVSPGCFARMQKRMLRNLLPGALVEELAKAGFSVKGARDSMLEVVRKDFLSMLKKYPGPVLIANGENDKLNRKYQPQLMAAAKQASVEIIPNSGHLCNLQQAEAFSCMVRKFSKMVYQN